jgi:hypothetical protein
MSGASLEQARAAKARLRLQLAGAAGVRGLGITTLDGGYALKVLVDSSAAGAEICREVDGVPVLVEVLEGLTLL